METAGDLQTGGLRMTVLASGSRGNAVLLETGRVRVLVDAGLAVADLAARLGQAGVEPERLDGILVTHEHGDHVRGLRQLRRRHGVAVWMNEGTRCALGWEPDQCRLFATGRPFAVGDLEVESFEVPHDAAEPVGFVMRAGGVAVGLATDLGFVTMLVRERLTAAHLLFLEANYDEVLLREDRQRPWSVKQRIAARHGHLSNTAAARLVAELAGRGRLRQVVLGHLSEDCNRPEQALEAMRAAGVGIPVSVATQQGGHAPVVCGAAAGWLNAED